MWIRILAIFLLLLMQAGAQQEFTPSTSETLESEKTVILFLKAAAKGDVAKARSYCDDKLGDGSRARQPAETQVTKLVSFLKTRTLKPVSTDYVLDDGKLVSFRFDVVQTNKSVFIGLRPFKGGKWLVTIVNLGD